MATEDHVLKYPQLARFKGKCDETYLQRLPQTLEGFKALVKLGLASTLAPVGSQLFEKWYKTESLSYNAPWDVAHYDAEGNAYLNWHFCIPDGVQFDAPEAMFYAGSGGIAAGTYYVPIGSTYGAGWTTDKNIQFTLSEAMDEGDQFVLDCGTNYANDPTDGRTWRVYAAGTTTVKQSGTTSNGTSGTLLGTIGATNAHRPEGILNAISRVVYGYGRWAQSAIRQWLNSTAGVGAWWTMQNAWDRPPAQLTSLRGFLAGYSESFINSLDTVDVVTALNIQEGFSETTETTQDRIFLPSLQEMYINPQLANVEGEDWDYNKALAEEAGLSGKFQSGQTYEILKKYRIDAQTSSAGVWLRSCGRGGAGNAWFVGGSGSVGNYGSCNAYRGCPACKIRKSA